MNDFLKISDPLQTQSIDILLGIQNNEQRFQAKLDKLKFEIQQIEKTLRKRLDTISNNADKFLQEKVAEMMYNAREAARQELSDIVNAKGWKKEIAATTEELETFNPGSEIKQLHNAMLEIEIRRNLSDGKIDPLIFQGHVKTGNPIYVEAASNSPFPLVTDQVLKEGQKLRYEKLKPIIAAKLQSLLIVQGNLEGAADLLMPVQSYDPIKEIVDSM